MTTIVLVKYVYKKIKKTIIGYTYFKLNIITIVAV